MLRIFPEIENPGAAPCDERNIVGAVENRSEHLTVGCKEGIAEARHRRRFLRLAPGECRFTVDLFEPQVWIVVGRFERRAGVAHHLARTLSSPPQSNSTPCPGRSGAVAKPSARLKGCVRKRSRPKPWTSRYDRFGTAASNWTVTSWAPCEVIGRLNASARWAILSQAVTPPQFVTSASGNVTPPDAIIFFNSYSVCRFSPVAIGKPPSRTIRRWPSTSSGIVGSSRQ